MRTKRCRVTLTSEERTDLLQRISAGTAAARTLMHARILLKADTPPGEHGLFDGDIAAAVETSVSTVELTDRAPHANARRELCHWGESRGGSDTGYRTIESWPA